MNEYGIWSGSSLDAPNFSSSRERGLPLLAGLRYGRVLFTTQAAALEYTFDVLPIAVASQPEVNSFTNQTSRRYVYGAGIMPLGFKLVFSRRRRYQPFIGISSGPLYFTKQVPVTGSARFNFLSSINAGVQIFHKGRNSLLLGYNIGHLSNAGIGRLNPGFNTNYFFVGFSTFR